MADAPSPLRRFVKRWRGDGNIGDAVSKKHRPVRNSVVWSILAKRRNSAHNEEEKTDEGGHRILSWIRGAPTGVPTETSRWSEQTYTSSLDDSTVPRDPDEPGVGLKAFAQTYAPVHKFVPAHEIEVTELVGLEDSSPGAKIPGRPIIPINVVHQYAQLGRPRYEELVLADRIHIRDEGTLAYQRRGLPPVRSRSIGGSLHPATVIPSNNTSSRSPVALTQCSDGTRMSPDDGKNKAQLSPNSAQFEELRIGTFCEHGDHLVPSPEDSDLGIHNSLETHPFLSNHMAVRLSRGGITLEEPKSIHYLLDGAWGDAGVAGMLDNARRVDTCDKASDATADDIKPMDSCTFASGQDDLHPQKSRQDMYDAFDIVRAGSFCSVEESEEDLFSTSGSICLSEFPDNSPGLQSTHQFLSMLNKLECWQTCPAGADDQVNGTVGTAGCSPLSSSGGDPPRKRQRQRSQFGSRHDQGQCPEEHGVTTKRKRTAARKVTFACPYSKKEPMQHRECYKYMLTRVRDVKQHLSRCHRLPMYCSRCGATFGTEESRDDHIFRKECIQARRSAVKPNGITEAQRQQLSQKSPANLSREDQWFGIWDILFPGTPRPASPYIDSELLQDITLYQDFLTTSGPQILSDVLTQRGAVITWSTSNGERELGTSQQSILEEGLRVVFDEWAGQNGMSRQASTATSSSSGSGRRNASPSLGSATMNESQPPQRASMLPQANHTISTEPRPRDLVERRFDRIYQTGLLALNEAGAPYAPEITPDSMRQVDYTIMGQPIQRIQRMTHSVNPPTGTGTPDGPYVPGLTLRMEEHPQFVCPDPIHGESVDFENDDLLVHFRGDDGRITPPGGRPSTYLAPFITPELDFRADV